MRSPGCSVQVTPEAPGGVLAGCRSMITAHSASVSSNGLPANGWGRTARRERRVRGGGAVAGVPVDDHGPLRIGELERVAGKRLAQDRSMGEPGIVAQLVAGNRGCPQVGGEPDGDPGG